MNQSEFINSLKNKCLNIKKDWSEHLDFWEGEEAGGYNDISVIVHYVVKNYEHGKTEDFEEIFKTVENAVNSNNKETSGLAVVGFLEGILFVGSHKDIRIENYKKWLGKESLKSITELENFFDGMTNK